MGTLGVGKLQIRCRYVPHACEGPGPAQPEMFQLTFELVVTDPDTVDDVVTLEVELEVELDPECELQKVCGVWFECGPGIVLGPELGPGPVDGAGLEPPPELCGEP